MSNHALNNNGNSPNAPKTLNFNALTGLGLNLIQNQDAQRYPQDLQAENELLKNYVKDLVSLVTQFEFTGQKVLETLTENFILQSKAITSELQMKCLIEALDIQLQEIQKRDTVILKLAEDLNEHNERIELISNMNEETQENTCKICFRNCNVVAKCDNHEDDEGTVGCAFCSLKKCPICRSEDIYHVLAGASRKIKKPAKAKAAPKNKKAAPQKKKK